MGTSRPVIKLNAIQAITLLGTKTPMKIRSTAFRLIASFLLVFSLVGFAVEPSSKQEAEMRASFGVLVPPERTAIFPSEKAAHLIRAVCYHPPALSGYWTPEAKDLESVENTLIEYIGSQNVGERKDWRRYRRQVIGVKRGNEKLLFIYYFSFSPEIEADLKARKTAGYDPEGWRRRPEVVFDGGSSFFRLLYDIHKKCFVWYERNGTA